jgi:hypothetical protein
MDWEAFGFYSQERRCSLKKLCSHASGASVGLLLVPAGLIPEGKFDAVPEP